MVSSICHICYFITLSIEGNGKFSWSMVLAEVTTALPTIFLLFNHNVTLVKNVFNVLLDEQDARNRVNH